MTDTWLILDTNYLCHRAFHVHADLSHDDSGTGVLFGVFKDIITLQKYHQTNKLLFAFDYGKGLRGKEVTSYKGTRKKQLKEMDDEQKQVRKDMLRQIDELREHWLKAAGFRNVFYQDGYEADDVIASLCQTLPQDDRIIIVSADKDLYQLLEGRISIWNPSHATASMVTLQTFFKKYGVMPGWWPHVKAIAGCVSDNVLGVNGVGEATAAKYLNKKLQPHLKTYQSIEASNLLIKANLRLTTLPFPGCKEFKVRPDRCSRKRWRAVCDKLGMESLRSFRPE